MSENNSVFLKAWGEYACFTRPELKVERVSYSVPTPSSARGLLEAILFKPEFRWQIEEIRVLKEIQFINLRRNEVQGVISSRNAESAMRGTRRLSPLMADDTDNEGEGRTQRQTIALKDVSYIIKANPRPFAASGSVYLVKKYTEQFNRRVQKGQCFQHPYFGCREFAASFSLPDGNERPIADSRDLGLMLYDIFDLNAQPVLILDDALLQKHRQLSLFEAKLENGIVRVPDWRSDHVKRAAGQEAK
ncbi:MAG: type I-C CRISPR-associated protein Cas5 [Elusimicrobia bacterium]|nr:type I-C CRISPR-associated protein Cas5 [Elusimicrobiota bacterium]